MHDKQRRGTFFLTLTVSSPTGMRHISKLVADVNQTIVTGIGLLALSLLFGVLVRMG